MVQGINLDACPIKALLEVVECAVRLLSGNHSFINVASWGGIVHWMRRWWPLYPDISSLLYLYVFIVFLDDLSFGANDQLRNSWGALALWAPRMLGLCIFSPQTLIHMSNPDWWVNGPFSIPGLGSWALCYIQILLSHRLNYKKNYSSIVIICASIILEFSFKIYINL